MESVLDGLKRIREIDREEMYKIVEQFPEQCEEAINVSKALEIPKEDKCRRPRNVIVAAMGGSAIGGNLLKDWLKNTLTIPIEVCRGYHLPAYANKDSLVLTISYSGNTEETLSSYLEAIERDCITIAITSGGLLQEFSEELEAPHIRLPRNYPPRSAIAYLFFPMVYSLEKLSLINPEEEIQEAVMVVKERRNEVKSDTPVALNPSKKLAIDLRGSIPFIGGFDLYESVALRMKTQFNENSKVPAKVEFFPELTHNETVGWTGSRSLTRNFSVILIRDRQEPLEIKTRIEATKKFVFYESAKKVLEIHAKGTSRLARMLSAMYVGDFASIYLAVLNRVDPTPVTIIDELKKYLEKKVNKRKELRAKFEKLKAG